MAIDFIFKCNPKREGAKYSLGRRKLQSRGSGLRGSRNKFIGFIKFNKWRGPAFSTLLTQLAEAQSGGSREVQRILTLQRRDPPAPAVLQLSPRRSAPNPSRASR